MHSKERVFAFDDPVDFLNFELRERRKQDPRFSLRAWSRQVGYKNPSYLAHVLGRKRRLKLELAEKLATDLKLDGRPRRYFELIVLGNAGKSEREKQTYRKLSLAIRPKKIRPATQISLETFAVVSEWYHIAILEMTQLSGFDSSLDFIYRRLNGKVSKPLIRTAVDRLLRVGLLKKQGKILLRASDSALMIESPAPSEAVRSYHREVGNLGQKAIDSQPVDERDFYGTTLAFKKANIEKARLILREAHRQVLDLAEHGTGEDLYQLNTQFFRLTAKPKGNK
ncbi:MAG: TIGR02147 family protein [Bdellovibrionota bacterium]